MKKYLLSTGKTTTQTERYIEDLFKIYLTVYPKDVPGADDIGFNFVMSDVKKDEVKSELLSRINGLINTIAGKFSSGITITINTLDIINEKKAKLVLDIGQFTSDEILLDL